MMRFAYLRCKLIVHLWTNEPSHEIMALFVLHKLILQLRSHPVGLDVWFLVGPFIYFHTSCMQTVKALARLRTCAGSTEPSLVAYVISTCTIISWARSNYTKIMQIIIWSAVWQKQNDLCIQGRLTSAWASSQSDQRLCCQHQEALGPGYT